MESRSPILTVREALEMPAFARAKVVAGHAGLDNRIRWVHIIDIPDADYEWGRRDVLLLTAGFGLQDNPDRQATLIPILSEQGFAGVVLSTGQYFQHTPRVIRKAADELGFPLIEIPSDVLFVDITEAIFERIINRQYALLQQSNRIHAKLTQLVLEGCNLSHLASTLASLLKRSVTIEDSSFRVLAATKHGPVDEARRRSVDFGRTTPKLAQRLIDNGIYGQLLEGMEPIHVTPMPDLGMTMERIVAPIIVGREVYGYIWIIAGDHPLNDLDELAIDHGATVAALILLKEQSARKAEDALRGDFFNQLLCGAADWADLAEQARQLRYRFSQAHQVILIQRTSQAGESVRSLRDAAMDCLRDRGTDALLVWRDDGLVLVIESNDPAVGRQLARSIVDDLSHPASRLLIGVGGICPPGNNETISIRTGYEQAREAVRVGTAMGQDEGVISFDELGLLHWLYHLPAEQRSGNIYLDHIRNLVAYDAEHNKELVKTLEAYLDYGGSLAEASQALYIHRNTLLNRIDRIEAQCAVDLRDPLQRLNLHVAIKCYRLHER